MWVRIYQLPVYSGAIEGGSASIGGRLISLPRAHDRPTSHSPSPRSLPVTCSREAKGWQGAVLDFALAWRGHGNYGDGGCRYAALKAGMDG